MPGVLIVEAIAQCGAVAVLAEEANRGKLAFFAGIDDVQFKRIVEPGDTLDLVCEMSPCAGRSAGARAPRTSTASSPAPARSPSSSETRRDRRGGRARLDHRARLQRPGQGGHERRALAHVDTSDEWIRERTGIRERRVATRGRGALRRLRCPRARAALAQAGVAAADLDLIIVATVTPDMFFPSTGGDHRRRARRHGRGCLRPLGRLHRLHVRDRAGVRDARRRPLAARARRSAATCSRSSSTGPTASTCVLFADGAGAVVLERGRLRRLPRLRARRRRRRRRGTSACRRGGSRIRRHETPRALLTA